jgi:hypothetical protein
MAIITGTALSTHTPLHVLQELEQGERLEAGQEQRIQVAPSADMRDEYIEPSAPLQTDPANLASK